MGIYLVKRATRGQTCGVPRALMPDTYYNWAGAVRRRLLQSNECRQSELDRSEREGIFDQKIFVFSIL